MKAIKQKFIYMGCLVALGVIIVVLGLGDKNRSTLFTMGIALIAAGAVKIIKYARIARNPDLIRQFEINQNEERVIFLATRSAYAAFWLVELLCFVAVIVLIAIGREETAMILSIPLCVQLLLYVIFYIYYSKKY